MSIMHHCITCGYRWMLEEVTSPTSCPLCGRTIYGTSTPASPYRPSKAELRAICTELAEAYQPDLDHIVVGIPREISIRISAEASKAGVFMHEWMADFLVRKLT